MEIFDYLEEHAYEPFEERQVCDLDLLVFSQLVHAPLERLTDVRLGRRGRKLCTLRDIVWPADKAEADMGRIVGPQRRHVWDFLARSTRFGEVRLMDFTSRVDESSSENATQFAAATFRCGDMDIVAFRGTDSTVHGWREDFNMGLDVPVPAQLLAANYPATHCRCKGDVYLCGHSKGGNLAVYSAVMGNPAFRHRIVRVCSFDGPGVSDFVKSSNAWNDMEDRIVSVIPQDSVIGLLLGYCRNARVVASGDKGLMQHNPFVWKVEGDGFVEAGDLSFGSKVTCRTLHEFLSGCTIDERRTLIESVFDLLACAEFTKVTELPASIKKNWAAIKKRFEAFPEQTKALLGRMLLTVMGLEMKSIGLEILGKIGKRNGRPLIDQQEDEW